jgi:D-alanyl-D-alanine carboxypeptidase (penicillin-binding protein 5/6)
MAAKRSNHKKWRFFVALLVTTLICAGGAVFVYQKPVPALSSKIIETVPAKSVTLPWPTYGQAAFGASGYGVLATHGVQKPVPTASVAKVMTALAVLSKHPLALGEQGPTITLTQHDQAVYDSYYVQGGSLVAIKPGEKITEYQALQAMLLPSANNMADTLATWAFGSIEKYATYANQFAPAHSMHDTTIADASGFSPKTMSTANDLVLLGQMALEHPVLAQVVAQKTAKVPIAGTIHNVNWLLGEDGVNGIKTGATDQAGAVYLASTKKKLPDGQNITFVTAIMKAPMLLRAMDDARSIMDTAPKYFAPKTPVLADQRLGTFVTPWDNRKVRAVATHNLSLRAWQGNTLETRVEFDHVTGPLKAGTRVGTVTAINGKQTISTSIVLSENMTGPSLKWRAQHL